MPVDGFFIYSYFPQVLPFYPRDLWVYVDE